CKCRYVLDNFSNFKAARVAPRQQYDQCNRDQLLQRQANRVPAERDWRNQIIVRRNSWNENAEKFCKRNRYRSDGSGLNDKKQGPAIQERDRTSVRFAQKNINPPRARQHGREFEATERARNS